MKRCCKSPFGSLCVAALGVVLFCFSEGFSEPLKVVYATLGEDSLRDHYYEDVLRLALDKSEVPYTLKIVEMGANSRRRALMVEDGEISLLWLNAHKNPNENLEPIRFPLCRGLLSYRAFITLRETVPSLSEIDSLEELRSLTVGQGAGWGDALVLENAGFTVMQAKYNLLFNMMEAKRFDILPRGFHEAYAEAAFYKKDHPALAVDPHVGLYYPQVVFFYVKKGNQQLKQVVITGLEKACDDGSFHEFMENHPFMRPALERPDRAVDRRWFEVGNPILPPEDWAAVQKYFDQEFLNSIR